MDDLIGSIVSVVSPILSPHGPPTPGSPASYVPGDYSIHFFLQLCVILIACRVIGKLGQRLLGQPQVVGEMIAGVVLGPSLLGLFFPVIQNAIFPLETKSVLYAGSQLGVGLYMFLVGTTLQTRLFKAKAKSAFGVSVAGIAAPFLVAFAMTPWLLTVPGLFTPGISQINATLFVGACIALTAFPMLARIINEHGLADSALGTLSLTAGAFDDAVSWCVLAVVLATFGGGPGVAILAIGGGIAYAAFIITLGSRLLAPLGRAVERDGEMGAPVLAITLALFCLSAFVMDALASMRSSAGSFSAPSCRAACLPQSSGKRSNH